jgi:murein DD-endopeptidase MepM/ murein hydrolase activator NlpD
MISRESFLANVCCLLKHQTHSVMKKFLVGISLIFVGFILINNFSSDSFQLKETTEKATLPFRYAELLAKNPETEIQIPIRSVRKKRLHQGQDIFAPRGTPVYSATEGYVWRIGENSLGGKTVSVLGAGGRVYYYAHLKDYAENLKTGDYVTPETILGFVGNTGNAKGTPPHLHFGVYTRSGAINPLTLFN